MIQTAERFYGGLAGIWRLTRSLTERVPTPIRTPFDSHLREQWLLRKIQEEEVVGKLDSETSEKLRDQVRSPQAKRFIRDVWISTAGLNVASFLISLPLSSLLMQSGHESLAILTATQTLPLVPKVGLASIVRAGYLTGRVIQDHLKGNQGVHRISKKAEALNLALAATSPFGNVSAIVRMSQEMPELSALLRRHTVGNILGVGSRVGRGFNPGSISQKVLLPTPQSVFDDSLRPGTSLGNRLGLLAATVSFQY